MSRTKYVSLSPALWKKRQFKQIVDSDCKAALLALYLRTNTRINMCGLYEVAVDTIRKETGLGEDVEECMNVLIELDYCRYDFESEYVWVIDMATTQVPGFPNSSNKQLMGVHNVLTRLYEEEAPFVLDFIHHYRDRFEIDEEKVTVLEYKLEPD